jgi:hypothetical protein
MGDDGSDAAGGSGDDDDFVLEGVFHEDCDAIVVRFVSGHLFVTRRSSRVLVEVPNTLILAQRCFSGMAQRAWNCDT